MEPTLPIATRLTLVDIDALQARCDSLGINKSTAIATAVREWLERPVQQQAEESGQQQADD